MSWRATGVCVGVGMGALLAWWAWRRRHPETPYKWEEVGEVGELVIYPLKSCHGVKVTEAEATRYGLAVDLLEDRSFVVTCLGRVERGRDNCDIFSVILTLDGSMVTLRSRKEEEEIEFDLQDVIRRGKVIEVIDFRDTNAMKGYDCGDEVATWLTKVTKITKNRQVRLAYNGDLTQNRVASYSVSLGGYESGSSYTFKQYKPSDRIVYGDYAAYSLISETSLVDLNGRMLQEYHVTSDWFRPNLVVRGVRQAYDEDDWAFVRIGDVVLRRVMPCCKYGVRYVDPETGIKSTNHQSHVLRETLLSAHQPKEPAVLRHHWKTTPVFGIHLGIDSCGSVRVGDKVLVARASSNPRWQL